MTDQPTPRAAQQAAEEQHAAAVREYEAAAEDARRANRRAELLRRRVRRTWHDVRMIARNDTPAADRIVAGNAAESEA